MVSDGKPRTAYTIPASRTHYHDLPSALIKPNTPKNLDSIDSTVDTVVDRMGGGPEGRSVRHPIMFADSGSAQDIRHGGDLVVLTPTTSIKAYDPILHIEANYFGKEFLRMAGIVKMLHIRRPPYGAQSK